MEAVRDELKKYIQSEMDSHESERILIADFLNDLLEDNGQADLMKSSMEAVIDAAEGAIHELNRLVPNVPTEADIAEGCKRFRVDYSVHFFNGSAFVVAMNSDTAEKQVLEDWGTRELTDGCQDTSTEIDGVVEVDNDGKEVNK